VGGDARERPDAGGVPGRGSGQQRLGRHASGVHAGAADLAALDHDHACAPVRLPILTIAKIHDLAAVYLGQPGEPVGPHLAALLRRARDRADAKIRNLQNLRERIDQALASDDLAGDTLRDTDPRRGAALDLAPGGKP
jgi:hypothetical protein